MSIGFPPRYRKTWNPRLPKAEVKRRVHVSLEVLGWRIEHEEDDRLIANTHPNAHKLGDRIVLEWQEGGVVRVTSRGAVMASLFDFGSNKKNVQTFFKALSVTSEEVS